MTQPEPFEIPYQLVAGVDIAPVAPFPPPKVAPQNPNNRPTNYFHNLQLVPSNRAQTHRFPQPPSHDPGESNDEGNPGPPRAARNQQWINLRSSAVEIIERNSKLDLHTRACHSPFRQLISSRLKGENTPYRAIYVDGQPGTGKSQMLLYLINRLMKQIPKMAIYYVLPNVPIFTILVDRSDPDNPIRVQFHITSLYEDWCTSGFPTIRIVDSVDPFAGTDIKGVFTVYAASPTKYENRSKPDHETAEWWAEYPLWTAVEFYTMMQKLDLTHRDYWIRPVNAHFIVALHPMVVTLLGTHGYLKVESGEASEEEEEEIPLNDGARSQEQTLPQPPSATANANVQPPVTPQTLGSTSTDHTNTIRILDVSESSALPRLKDHPPSADTVRIVPVSAMDGSTPEGSSTPPSTQDTWNEDLSSPDDNDCYVFLNVIEVFGLSPRALSADLDNTFRRMSMVFGYYGAQLFDEHTSLVISSLSATHLGGNPVSMFASRLKTAMSRFQKEIIVQFFDNKKLPGAVRGILLEHTVNQELLRSHARFTVFPASPDDHIKLFTFQITVNPKHKDVSFRLIQSLKGRLASQYPKALPEVNDAHSSRLAPKKKKTENREVEVYFIWIVKPQHVPEYQRRTRTFVATKIAESLTPQNRRSRDYLTYKIGVVSVTDLLFNEHSGMNTPITELGDDTGHQWTPSSDAFKECFVMMEELRVDPNESLEVEALQNPPPEPTEAETAETETADEKEGESGVAAGEDEGDWREGKRVDGRGYAGGVYWWNDALPFDPPIAAVHPPIDCITCEGWVGSAEEQTRPADVVAASNQARRSDIQQIRAGGMRVSGTTAKIRLSNVRVEQIADHTVALFSFSAGSAPFELSVLNTVSLTQAAAISISGSATFSVRQCWLMEMRRKSKSGGCVIDSSTSGRVSIGDSDFGRCSCSGLAGCCDFTSSGSSSPISLPNTFFSNNMANHSASSSLPSPPSLLLFPLPSSSGLTESFSQLDCVILDPPPSQLPLHVLHVFPSPSPIRTVQTEEGL
ncbi:hypothetical protein BLNAU_23598 [Blattamonas nauphoetae]|uniref:Uncharacterized protein n=1 Tax=Blattamonas nauphoetae TaxID=2049346 RepID=A0ABQ9WPR7_9EUKA|nr:hypothetical protein BLNAU_23598 [Blattamonas nauphoetae]